MKITKARLREIIREEWDELYDQLDDHPLLQYAKDDPTFKQRARKRRPMRSPNQQQKTQRQAPLEWEGGLDPLANDRFKMAADQSEAKDVARKLDEQVPLRGQKWKVIAVIDRKRRGAAALRISADQTNQLNSRTWNTFENALGDYSNLEVSMLTGGNLNGFTTHWAV